LGIDKRLNKENVNRNKKSWVSFSFIVVLLGFMAVTLFQWHSVNTLEEVRINYASTIESLKEENRQLERYKTEVIHLRKENSELYDKIENLNSKEGENEELSDFMRSLQPKLDVEVSKIIATKIIESANEFGFPPALIASLMYRESSFNMIAVSSAKCVGLMQINPSAHVDKIEEMELEYHDLFSINENIKLGCMILHEYYSSEKDIRKALTRYVGGSHDNYVNDILSMYSNYQISEFGKVKAN
jgi:hypothetical protein